MCKFVFKVNFSGIRLLKLKQKFSFYGVVITINHHLFINNFFVIRLLLPEIEIKIKPLISGVK